MLSALQKSLSLPQSNTVKTVCKQEQTDEALCQLADSKLIHVFILSALAPLLTYVYTARWKACLYFLSASLLIGGVGLQASANDSQKLNAVKLALSVGLITTAAVDNSLSILRARKRLNN